MSFTFFTPDPTGGARAIDDAEADACIARGVPVFGTLVGCVLHAGVHATAFDRAVGSELLYDGRDGLEAFAAGRPLEELTPIGRAPTHRIAATPEEGLIHPPRRIGTS